MTLEVAARPGSAALTQKHLPSIILAAFRLVRPASPVLPKTRPLFSQSSSVVPQIGLSWKQLRRRAWFTRCLSSVPCYVDNTLQGPHLSDAEEDLVQLFWFCIVHTRVLDSRSILPQAYQFCHQWIQVLTWLSVHHLTEANKYKESCAEIAVTNVQNNKGSKKGSYRKSSHTNAKGKK